MDAAEDECVLHNGVAVPRSNSLDPVEAAFCDAADLKVVVKNSFVDFDVADHGGKPLRRSLSDTLVDYSRDAKNVNDLTTPLPQLPHAVRDGETCFSPNHSLRSGSEDSTLYHTEVRSGGSLSSISEPHGDLRLEDGGQEALIAPLAPTPSGACADIVNGASFAPGVVDVGGQGWMPMFFTWCPVMWDPSWQAPFMSSYSAPCVASSVEATAKLEIPRHRTYSDGAVEHRLHPRAQPREASDLPPERRRGFPKSQVPRDGQRVSSPYEDIDFRRLANTAVTEISAQLVECDGRRGRIWIPDWHARYGFALGSLRQFLHCRPDLFRVMPGTNMQFTVALVEERERLPRSPKRRSKDESTDIAPLTLDVGQVATAGVLHQHDWPELQPSTPISRAQGVWEDSRPQPPHPAQNDNGAVNFVVSAAVAESSNAPRQYEPKSEPNELSPSDETIAEDAEGEQRRNISQQQRSDDEFNSVQLATRVPSGLAVPCLLASSSEPGLEDDASFGREVDDTPFFPTPSASVLPPRYRQGPAWGSEPNSPPPSPPAAGSQAAMTTDMAVVSSLAPGMEAQQGAPMQPAIPGSVVSVAAAAEAAPPAKVARNIAARPQVERSVSLTPEVARASVAPAALKAIAMPRVAAGSTSLAKTPRKARPKVKQETCKERPVLPAASTAVSAPEAATAAAATSPAPQSFLRPLHGDLRAARTHVEPSPRKSSKAVAVGLRVRRRQSARSGCGEVAEQRNSKLMSSTATRETSRHSAARLTLLLLIAFALVVLSLLASQHVAFYRISTSAAQSTSSPHAWTAEETLEQQGATLVSVTSVVMATDVEGARARAASQHILMQVQRQRAEIRDDARRTMERRHRRQWEQHVEHQRKMQAEWQRQKEMQRIFAGTHTHTLPA